MRLEHLKFLNMTITQLFFLLFAGVVHAQNPPNPRELWIEATRAHALPLFGELKLSYFGVDPDDTIAFHECRLVFERNKKLRLERYRLEPNEQEVLFYLGNEFLLVSNRKKTKNHIISETPQIPEYEDISYLLYEPFFKHDAFFTTLPDATFDLLGQEKLPGGLCDVIRIVQYFAQEQLKIERKVFIEQKSRMIWGYENKVSRGSDSRFERCMVSMMDLSKPVKSYFSISQYAEYKDIDTDFGLNIGDQAPDLDLRSLSDSLVKVSDFLGRVVVLDFWYFACAPCRLSTPFLDELSAKYQDKGLMVLGINAQDKDKSLLEAFRQKYQVSYPLFVSSPKSMRLYGVHSFPTFVVLDKTGTIAAKFDGYSKYNMKFLQQSVEELLSN